MLKKIMVTSPILVLFLFSISFLPLTQITEAEAQFSNKIQKQRSLSDAIRKPTPGTLTDKEKKKVLGKRMEWNFDTPMEKLIHEINISVLDERQMAKEINVYADNLINHTSANNPYRIGVTNTLRNMVQEQIGCDAPIMYGNYEGLCGTLESYSEMLRQGWEAPFIMGYRTHKQLLFCDLPPGDIDIGTGFLGSGIPQNAQSSDPQQQRNYQRTFAAIQQSPLSVKLRSLGKEFGTCFCKFGSRQGTHPSQGYENIVPDRYSNVCPL